MKTAEGGGWENMTEVVNPHLMLRSQMVSAEHQRTPISFSQKSKKARQSEDYSPPIAYAHTDGILRSSLTDPPFLMHGEKKRRRAKGE